MNYTWKKAIFYLTTDFPQDIVHIFYKILNVEEK